MSDVVGTLPDYSAFLRSVGSCFLINDTCDTGLENTTELTLSEVTPQAIDSGFSSYSLLFQSKAFLAGGQGCYLLRHDDLGTFEVFLVPVQSASGNAEYEAVFNQLAYDNSESEN